MKKGRLTEPPFVTLTTPEQSVQEGALTFSVSISHSDLRPYPRSAHQLNLLNRVVQLRELEGMTFKEIAQTLRHEGATLPRNGSLSEEAIYSLVKKSPSTTS